MTPKEKAKELTSKMLQYQPLETKYRNEKANFEFAKQCALIALEYIMEFTEDNYRGYYEYGFTWKYWQDVKTEIEKL